MQDFGDYADDYYAVQTTEGEQIAQLISGYIDIILKKVRLFDHWKSTSEWMDKSENLWHTPQKQTEACIIYCMQTGTKSFYEELKQKQSRRQSDRESLWNLFV